MNKTLVNVQIRTILPYSAKKKNTNITAACSVINPLTNSDSKKKIEIKFRLILYRFKPISFIIYKTWI